MRATFLLLDTTTTCLHYRAVEPCIYIRFTLYFQTLDLAQQQTPRQQILAFRPLTHQELLVSNGQTHICTYHPDIMFAKASRRMDKVFCVVSMSFLLKDNDEIIQVKVKTGETIPVCFGTLLLRYATVHTTTDEVKVWLICFLCSS